MENKYFIPDIEDLCVGYECEYNFARAYTNEFDFVKISYKDVTPGKGGYTNELTNMIHLIDDGAAVIRVPYLTKEQIENEGWTYKTRSTDLWFERKEIFLRYDGYHLENIKLQYGLHDYRLKISFVYVGDNEESTNAYLGECKDINTFRKIIKLLKI